MPFDPTPIELDTKPDSDVVRALRGARALLSQGEHCWCKDRFFTTNGQMCALGALSSARAFNGLDHLAYLEGSEALSEACGMYVANFNDLPTTTYRDILALFDRAIAQQEAL